MGEEEIWTDRRIMPERTSNCSAHEDRMDKVDSDINRGKGWFQASAGFSGIAIVVVGLLGTNINSKLSNIETMLTGDKSDIRLLNEQVKNLQADVKDIIDRNRYLDNEKHRITGGGK